GPPEPHPPRVPRPAPPACILGLPAATSRSKNARRTGLNRMALRVGRSSALRSLALPALESRVCLRTDSPLWNSLGASPQYAAADSADRSWATGGSSARTAVAVGRPIPLTDSRSSASAARAGVAATSPSAWAWTRSASRERSLITRATDWRAAGGRLGAASRFFSAAAIARSSSRRRTRAWSWRTSGGGGTQARGLRSRQNSAMALASAGSVLFACPQAFAYALTRAGLATLTRRPASCRWVAIPSESGPVASRQKWTTVPGASWSAQASRAAWPLGSLANRFGRVAPPGPSRQASSVSLDTSIPAKCVAVLSAVPTASLPSGSRMRGRLGVSRPGMASEVEGAGGRSAVWFPRSVPHPLHAVDPAAGRRLNDPGKLTCETLHPTRPTDLIFAACLLAVVAESYRGRAGELYVRPQRAHGWASVFRPCASRTAGASTGTRCSRKTRPSRRT